MRPWIGITCNFDEDDTISTATDLGTPGQDWNYLAGDYITAIEEAGGLPVLLPRCGDPSILESLLARLDGVLISGGHDVDPAQYGSPVQSYCGKLSPQRDALDLYVLRYALEHKMPLLGICRGIQILNAALGGTLYQDLQKEGSFSPHTKVSDGRRNYPVHSVALAEHSRLRQIFGADEIPVNSFHHQAVREPAPGTTVAAVSADGVIEAMELPGEPFVVAVQWHPEMMFDSTQQKCLFRAFIQACQSGNEL